MTLRAVLFAALQCAPAVAFAQQSDASVDRARSEFETGQRALDEGRFSDAARAFERSVSASRRPGTLFNLGLTYRALGRCTDAIEAFEGFISLSHDEERIANTQTVLSDLRACPATVHLSLVGEPSEVAIDGRPRPLRSGEITLRLDPGRHVIEARRHGYAPARREVDLDRGGEQSLTLDVSRAPYDGWLRVDVSGTPTVRIDGETVTTDGGLQRLRAGRHGVQVQYGATVQHREVEIPPGGRVTVSFTAPTESTPVTQRWWFWTLVGVATAGAVTAAVLATETTAPAPSDNLWTRVRIGP